MAPGCSTMRAVASFAHGPTEYRQGTSHASTPTPAQNRKGSAIIGVDEQCSGVPSSTTTREISQAAQREGPVLIEEG